MTNGNDRDAKQRELDRRHDTNQRQIDRRTEMQTAAARGLFLLNGGGALALLAFLQKIWIAPVTAPLVPWIVSALVPLIIGLCFAGTYGEVRAASSRAHSDAWNNIEPAHQKILKQAADKWFALNRLWPIISVAWFAVSMLIVVVGAFYNLPGGATEVIDIQTPTLSSPQSQHPGT